MGERTSLILPAYNEEEGISLVIEECIGKVDEIIVVDDGSTDRTYEIASKYPVKLYRHERNMGKVAAIRTGIEQATGDIIILMDADYTYPAKYIPLFVEEIKRGADLVLGSRFRGGESNIPLLNRLGNRIFSIIASYIGCVNITDAQTGYRAFRKEKFRELDVDAKGLEFETKMTVRAAKLGYRIVEIPIEYRKRIGKSKLRRFRDGLKMFTSLFSVAVHETSLLAKMIIIPSLLFIFVGLIAGFISIYEKFKYGILKHEYYPLITTFLILVAIQLISISLIIDYLAKKLDRIEYELRRGK